MGRTARVGEVGGCARGRLVCREGRNAFISYTNYFAFALTPRQRRTHRTAPRTTVTSLAHPPSCTHSPGSSLFFSFLLPSYHVALSLLTYGNHITHRLPQRRTPTRARRGACNPLRRYLWQGTLGGMQARNRRNGSALRSTESQQITNNPMITESMNTLEHIAYVRLALQLMAAGCLLLTATLWLAALKDARK